MQYKETLQLRCVAFYSRFYLLFYNSDTLFVTKFKVEKNIFAKRPKNLLRPQIGDSQHLVVGDAHNIGDLYGHLK